MNRMGRTAGWLFLALAVALLGLVIHETGHGLTAVLCGGQVTKIKLLALQIWPAMRWTEWDGLFGGIWYRGTDRDGLVLLMGSGSTALLGLCAAIALQFTGSRSFLRTVCLAAAVLLPLDILSYSIFPALGLRHWILFGGYGIEPLEGALAMGIPRAAYYAGLAVWAAVCYGLVLFHLRRKEG
jgi:hypothetical protein